jgi:hypothetical protein
MQRYLSFGYWTAIVGGVLLTIGAVLSTNLDHVAVPFSAQVASSLWVVSAALRLAGTIGVTLGLTAVYVRESERARLLGLIAYALVTINLIVQAGVMFTDLFIAGAFSKYAPGVLDGTMEDGRLSAGFLLAWVLPFSFLLLGIASLRAGVYRKVVGWAFIVMGAATLVALPFNGPVVEVTIGVACVVVGAFARRVPELVIESPTPASVLAQT